MLEARHESTPMARFLLKLYPQVWRARYGEEFLALLADAPFRFRHVVDVVSGAVDARLSGWRSPAPDSTQEPQGGAAVLQRLKDTYCYTQRVSTRDSWIGAAVMLGVAALGTAIGVGADKAGYVATGQFLIYFSFFVALQTSMLFTYLKGKPAHVQVVMAGGPLVLVGAILGAAMFYARV